MATEGQKYLAEVKKIAGFALMTPFGRYFLILSEINMKDLTIMFWVHLLVSFILFCWGVIMIQKAYEEVRE